MNRLNRRRFLALSSAGATSAVLVACGNESPSTEEMNPTQIPDVAGAPPTLAPITATPESGGGSAGGGEATGGGDANSVTIEAGDIYFDPTEFTVPAGGTITLNNAGMLQHDFAVDEWGEVVIGPLNGGESGDFTVPEDAQDGDTFTFYCSIPGHREAGMEGTVTIGAASGGGEAATASPVGEEEATAAASPAEDEAAAGGAGTVEVESGELYFKPNELKASPGDTLVMHNAGVLQHDLVIEDWDDLEAIPLIDPDATHEFTIPDDAEVGTTVTFYCSVPSHREAGMEGKLTIV